MRYYLAFTKKDTKPKPSILKEKNGRFYGRMYDKWILLASNQEAINVIFNIVEISKEEMFVELI